MDSRTNTDWNSTWHFDNPLDSAAYGGQRWYWSLTMQKHLHRSVTLQARIARDHRRCEARVGFGF